MGVASMPTKRRVGIDFAVFALAALALGSCTHSPKFNFNEGPPRVNCRPEQTMFAIVGKPFPWSCVIAGDLAKYADAPIAVEITVKMREDYPARSVVGLGLPRVFGRKTIFDEEYYRDLTGNTRIGPDDRNVEIIRPGDPTAPPEPIEGIEASLDGSFWIHVTFLEVTYYDPATRRADVRVIGSGRINGKLNCP